MPKRASAPKPDTRVMSFEGNVNMGVAPTPMMMLGTSHEKKQATVM